jgi:hypothetical protein
LDCRHVCKTCAFPDALQVGKQKEFHPPYPSDLAPAGAGIFPPSPIGLTHCGLEVTSAFVLR